MISVEADTTVITETGDDDVIVNNSTTTYVDSVTTLFTGAGDDQITYDGVSSNLWATAAMTPSPPKGRFLTVYGGEGNDILTNGKARNSLYGDAENITLTGGGSSHLTSGPAVAAEFGPEDTIELTGSQTILDGLVIRTVLAEDGTHANHLFQYNGKVLFNLDLAEHAGFTEPPVTLLNAQFVFQAA
ncbi:hypothetical protein [uncultured Sulfitobacter sp.]|uniref:hypothetical protein n=1 Tax=uncultured Sulfitobacter sp. TaxID=191468 RepID=UPI002638F573|nr:hypothetical protein [uncultured Sulfitobacter sp.]